jgi:hypothetical protein
MKTNLTIVFYFGERRIITNKTKDKLFLLKQQVKYLLNTQHSLDQITFVINGEKPNEYDEIIYPLKLQYNLKTLERENIGIAYGGYSHSIDHFINDFDFFIFSEDDWVFCYDNFDKYLLNKFNEDQNTSMICAVSSENDEDSHKLYGSHASVSIFGSSKEKIKELINQYGCLPYSKYGYQYGQVYQTSKFFKIGKAIDITDDFLVKFSDKRGYQEWGSKNNKELCKQLDLIEN